MSKKIKLYKPEKYPVIIGEGKNVGFCTVWSDPEKVLAQAPELRQKAALIGSLYSQEGVNIILRNLCLNPEIGYLLIWARGELSQTPYGTAGVKIINSLWKEGVSKNRVIGETGFRVHPEIDLNILRQMVANVALIDVSQMSLKQAVGKIEELPPRRVYMRPVAFPEHQPEIGVTFPSEEVGFLVRGKKTVDAWLGVVDRILRYGFTKPTEYGNLQKELPVVTWVIEEEKVNAPYIPDWPKEILEAVGLKKEALSKYFEEFLSPAVPEGTVYTYGQRLRAYPEKNGPLDQVKEIIAHIKKCKTTRRAVAVTLYPPVDKESKSPPCINLIQALVVNDRLCLFVTVRSHDIFKAGIPNAFGLLALQEYIAKEVGYPPGKLSITSNSAHIYEEDWDKAQSLLRCQIWERKPSLVFDPTTQQDPRGNILIRIEGKKIALELVDFSGNPILAITGKTAREIAKKLAQLNLLSRPDHWLDIGSELAKAETALKRGIPYKQDA